MIGKLLAWLNAEEPDTYGWLRDLEEAREREAARWQPQFTSGVYRYDQHEDGRRRAVRIVDGESPLDHGWILLGAQVPA